MPPPRRKLRFRLLRAVRWGVGLSLILSLVTAILSTSWTITYETQRLHVRAGAGDIVLITSESPSDFFDSTGFHVRARNNSLLRLSMPSVLRFEPGMRKTVLPGWSVIVTLIAALALLSWIDPHSLARRTGRRCSDGRATLRWAGAGLTALLSFGWLVCQAGHRVSVAFGQIELILCDRLRLGVSSHDSTAFCIDDDGRPQRIMTGSARTEDAVWHRRLGLVGIEFLRVYDVKDTLPADIRGWVASFQEYRNETYLSYDGDQSRTYLGDHGRPHSTKDFEAILAAVVAPRDELIRDPGAPNNYPKISPDSNSVPADGDDVDRAYREVLIRMEPLANLAHYLNRPLPISPPQGPGSEFIKITSTTLLLPYWAPMALVFIPTAWLWYRRLRGRQGHCDVCGYNLTGLTSDKCPECGTPIVRRIGAVLSPNTEPR